MASSSVTKETEYFAFDPCVFWQKGGNEHKVTHFLEFDIFGNVHTSNGIWRLVVIYGDSLNIEFNKMFCWAES